MSATLLPCESVRNCSYYSFMSSGRLTHSRHKRTLAPVKGSCGEDSRKSPRTIHSFTYSLIHSLYKQRNARVMGISDYFLRRKNAQWLRRHPTRELVMMPLPEAKDIGILFSEESVDQASLEAFVARLIKEGKRVRALTYFETTHSYPYQFKVDSFIKKEISLFGDIRNEKVSQFMEFRFDYLFCVTQQDFLPFDYILIHANAKIRVGMYQAGKENLFDLMIQPQAETPVSEWLDQIYEYTHKISLSLHEH